MPSITQKIIYKILEAGGKAPSGSNSQPWRFKINGNQIEILALPEKDHPILNFRHRGTWVAHGALIENIIIAANALGYHTEVFYPPLLPESKTTAKITLSETVVINKDLYEAIFHRATNRKPYLLEALNKEQKIELLKQAQNVNSGEFILIEDVQKIRELAKASSANEILMLEEQSLHKLFFEEIVWTEEEERRKQHGLYLKTMELKPPADKILKLLSNWRLMSLLAKLGFAKKIAKTNEESYAACPAIGAIIIENNDDQFLSAGRIMERVWLTATKLGLSCHLMTGVIFFWQQLSIDPNFISKTHANLIEESYQQIAKTAGVEKTNKIVALLMRIGQADKPSGHSSKVPIKNLILQ